MIHTVIAGDSTPFIWLDVVEPTRDELIELAAAHGLHLTSVEDSLQPEHLPKYEHVGTADGEENPDALFIIVRAYDELARPEAFTMQQLTRKLALFVSPKVLLTIHRQDQPYIQKIRETWSSRVVKPDSLAHVVNDLFRGVIDSYDKPIAQLLDGQTQLEARTFRRDSDDNMLEDGYFVRRRASVYSYMLSLTGDILANLLTLKSFSKGSRPFFRDLKDKCERLSFYADDIRDNVDNILSLYLALSAQATNAASHKTNEVMRLLTVFSAFFLPLNFIASIYGMNFEFMPELKWRLGYYTTLTAMALVATSIFVWFRRKGWMKQ